MEFRIAIYQMLVSGDIEANASRICSAIDQAAERRAEILLTPEGSLSGYTPRFDRTLLARHLPQVLERARSRGVGLALGTCFEEDDGRCYNQIRFYRPDGEYLGFHSKTLRCGTMREPVEGEVNDYACCPLHTFAWREGLTIGGLICNDMWANPQCTPMPDPHLSQQLASMGARVILHAVNGGRDGSAWSALVWNYHEANLRMRAAAGKLWIATVDNAAPEHLPCAAPSGFVSPNGDFVARTRTTGEDLIVYTVSL